jgi:hypothetical protein
MELLRGIERGTLVGSNMLLVWPPDEPVWSEWS